MKNEAGLGLISLFLNLSAGMVLLAMLSPVITNFIGLSKQTEYFQTLASDRIMIRQFLQRVADGEDSHPLQLNLPVLDPAELAGFFNLKGRLRPHAEGNGIAAVKLLFHELQDAEKQSVNSYKICPVLGNRLSPVSSLLGLTTEGVSFFKVIQIDPLEENCLLIHIASKAHPFFRDTDSGNILIFLPVHEEFILYTDTSLTLRYLGLFQGGVKENQPVRSLGSPVSFSVLFDFESRRNIFSASFPGNDPAKKVSVAASIPRSETVDIVLNNFKDDF